MPEVLALVRNFLMQASNVAGLPTVAPLDSIDFGADGLTRWSGGEQAGQFAACCI